MKNHKIELSEIKNPIHFLALGFGSGLSPLAPGTMGTIVAVPIYLLLSFNLTQAWYAFIVLVMLAFGVWLCHQSAKELGVHDHPGIVWDEIVGYLITMFMAPAGWLWVLVGFVLFRIFDIVKPWPIKTIDRKMAGGLGIMLDDVLAAIYAWAILQIIVTYVS